MLREERTVKENLEKNIYSPPSTSVTSNIWHHLGTVTQFYHLSLLANAIDLENIGEQIHFFLAKCWFSD